MKSRYTSTPLPLLGICREPLKGPRPPSWFICRDLHDPNFPRSASRKVGIGASDLIEAGGWVLLQEVGEAAMGGGGEVTGVAAGGD